MNEKIPTFDETITQECEHALTTILGQHPELRGLAVIIDWNLPPNVANGLPVGVYKTPDEAITAERCCDMQKQFARFTNHLSKLVERVLRTSLARYQEVAGTPAHPPTPPPQGIQEAPAPAPTLTRQPMPPGPSEPQLVSGPPARQETTQPAGPPGPPAPAAPVTEAPPPEAPPPAAPESVGGAQQAPADQPPPQPVAPPQAYAPQAPAPAPAPEAPADSPEEPDTQGPSAPVIQ